MAIKRSTIFASLTALSFFLAAILAIAFVNSFTSDWQLFSFQKDGETIALRSRFGQFVFVGPPIEHLTKPLPRELVFQMSNADFDWTPIGFEYVCGAVRRDSPTWQVYVRFVKRNGNGMGLEPQMRIFIARFKDDPNRFVPAHMLLMLAAESKRTKPRIPDQKWLETGFHFDADGARVPEVIIRANETQTAPNFHARWNLTQEWNDVMETSRGAVFHGWIWLGLMLLPLAFITRPRRRKTTLLRWTFNSVALVSSIICLAAITLWIRSLVADDQFVFSRRLAPKVSNMDVDSITSLGSSKGRLMIIRKDDFHQKTTYRDPWGYEQKSRPWPTPIAGLTVVGEKSARFPGVELYELPSQMLTFPTQRVLPGRAIVPAPAFPQLHFGVRALSIRWWLIVLASALIPAAWLSNAIFWGKRILKRDREHARQCPACGYDIRATPQQCPECGHRTVPV